MSLQEFHFLQSMIKIGIPRGELYIYNGELATAEWIENYHYSDIRNIF